MGRVGEASGTELTWTELTWHSVPEIKDESGGGQSVNRVRDPWALMLYSTGVRTFLKSRSVSLGLGGLGVVSDP